MTFLECIRETAAWPFVIFLFGVLVRSFLVLRGKHLSAFEMLRVFLGFSPEQSAKPTLELWVSMTSAFLAAALWVLLTNKCIGA